MESVVSVSGKKVRIISVAVQVDAVVDDGDSLTPLSVQPLQVPYHQWDGFAAEGLAAAVADLQRQVDGHAD